MLPAIASGTKLSSLPAPGHRLSSRASWPCEAQLLKSRPSTFEVYRVLIPGYELRSFLARHSSRTSLPQSYQERTPPLALLRLPASSRPSVSLRTRASSALRSMLGPALRLPIEVGYPPEPRFSTTQFATINAKRSHSARKQKFWSWSRTRVCFHPSIQRTEDQEHAFHLSIEGPEKETPLLFLLGHLIGAASSTGAAAVSSS